jgi:transcriptional regulator with XRE-family HTH domain
VYRVQDWAEVKRLRDREGLSKKAIAERLSMSRTTVDRLLSLPEPPSYERPPASSLLDPYRDTILSLLRQDARAASTVIRERLQAEGSGAARPSSRTTSRR